MSKFILKSETPAEELDWGKLTWLSRPSATGAEHLTVIDIELFPGKGHDFHKHPGQEETITCIEGTIEQWIGDEKKILGPGDSVFVAKDTVHATFNVGDKPAHLMVTLGPCVGAEGYELIDVFEDEPWCNLRN